MRDRLRRRGGFSYKRTERPRGLYRLVFEYSFGQFALPETTKMVNLKYAKYVSLITQRL